MLQIFKNYLFNKSLKKVIFYFLTLTLFLNYYYQTVFSSNLNQKPETSKSKKELSYLLNENYYILGPGDLIDLTFISMPEWSLKTTILNDGIVQVPIIGPVYLSGKSLNQAEKEIKNSLKEELISPEVQISIVKARPLRISIIGEVARPGLYTFSSNSNLKKGKDFNLIGLPTLFDGIKQAGGITNETNLNKVILKRKLPSSSSQQFKQTQVSLTALIKEGDQTQNPFLFDGDVITLQKAIPLNQTDYKIYKTNLSPEDINVTIAGEINNPGRYNIKSTSTLNELLMNAGGLKYGRASKYNIDLIRFRSNGSISKQTFKFNLNAAASTKNNPTLVEDDIIRVRRNFLAQTGDSINTISSPLSGIVTTFSLFKLLSN